MHSLTLQYHFSVSLRGSLLCQHQVLCKCHRVIYIYLDIISIYLDIIYIYLDIIYIYLPALQIQSTYPVSSRSSRCDSLSAMKPARDSTLSFSFANSLHRRRSSSVLWICLIGFSVVVSPLPPPLHCFDCIVSPDPENPGLDT